MEEGAQIAQVTPRTNAAVVDFVVTLPPGASFVQRYTLPGSYRFHTVGDTEANGQLEVSGTGFLTSSPLNGESGVAPTRETIVAFSGPLDPATVTQAAFAAEVAGQPLAYRIKLSEDKRRVTLFYDAPLPGNARVRISMDGAILRAVDGEPVDVDSDNQPGGLGVLEFNTLSLNLIPGTSVCGRVFASELASNGQMSVNTPLPGVTITVDGREAELRAMTDEKGNFCLDPAPAGRFFVHIDGRTATTGVPAQSYYPFVGKAWESVAGDTRQHRGYLPAAGGARHVAAGESDRRYRDRLCAVGPGAVPAVCERADHSAGRVALQRRRYARRPGGHCAGAA